MAPYCQTGSNSFKSAGLIDPLESQQKEDQSAAVRGPLCGVSQHVALIHDEILKKDSISSRKPV